MVVRSTLAGQFVAAAQITSSLQGKCGKYIFQMSHGTPQIKLSELGKNRNGMTAPLRKKTRDIWRMVYADPGPDKHEKIRELFRTCP